jgi:hypothetical protein
MIPIVMTKRRSAEAARMPRSATAPSRMALAKEYQTYTSRLAELARDEGKFVLIHETDIAGVYPTYEECLQAGYQRFGLEQPFLVKQICAVESPVILG